MASRKDVQRAKKVYPFARVAPRYAATGDAEEVYKLDWKQSVKVATAALENVSDLSLVPMTIDGVVLSIGDRVLLKSQTTTSENGIYVYGYTGLTRTIDAAAGTLSSGAACFVESGTTNSATMWYLATSDPIVVGTTPLSWARFFPDGGGFWSSAYSNSIFTTGSVAIRGTETTITKASDKGTDVFFYVSGSRNSKDAGVGTSLFGGDVFISGSTYFDASILEMTGTISLSGSLQHGYNTLAIGANSHAGGLSTSAEGTASTAIGYLTRATGGSAVAMGALTLASGDYAVTHGARTTGSLGFSYAHGELTLASGYASHAEGYGTIASSYYSHAEGNGTTAAGGASHAEGYNTQATKDASHSEGYGTIASGYVSHAEGSLAQTIGDASHAEGSETIASGSYSHAEGRLTITSGSFSHAEGEGTKTSGIAAHSEGYFTIASGNSSHAEGYGSTASGQVSHANGFYTLASGYGSHTKGYYTTGSGDYSVAQGFKSEAVGLNSFAGGVWTIASGTNGQTTLGRYNTRGNNFSLFVIGNGSDDNNRSDVLRVQSNGLEVTGSVRSTMGFSGSLTRLTDNTPYIIGTGAATVTTGSTGQLTINVVPGSVTVPGADTQVIFNDSTSLGADSAFTFNKTTKIVTTREILPEADSTYNLGSSTRRWANVYTGDLHLKNDRGDWTLIEEEDCLTVRNNITGKRYKISMTPID